MGYPRELTGGISIRSWAALLDRSIEAYKYGGLLIRQRPIGTKIKELVRNTGWESGDPFGRVRPAFSPVGSRLGLNIYDFKLPGRGKGRGSSPSCNSRQRGGRSAAIYSGSSILLGVSISAELYSNARAITYS